MCAFVDIQATVSRGPSNSGEKYCVHPHSHPNPIPKHRPICVLMGRNTRYRTFFAKSACGVPQSAPVPNRPPSTHAFERFDTPRSPPTVFTRALCPSPLGGSVKYVCVQWQAAGGWGSPGDNFAVDDFARGNFATLETPKSLSIIRPDDCNKRHKTHTRQRFPNANTLPQHCHRILFPERGQACLQTRLIQALLGQMHEIWCC